MLIHYVEDDEVDIRLVSDRLRSDPDLELSFSKTVDGIRDQILVRAVDGILLDLHRPDAKSLADDVSQIRAVTQAPIVFTTGDSRTSIVRMLSAAGPKLLWIKFH